jgi:putative heme-binding domain-containing protein
MRPASIALIAVSLCLCAFSRNSASAWAQATAANADAAKPDFAAGQKLFEQNCSMCHGVNGGGGRGPNLHTPNLRHASDEKSLTSVIANGIAPEMPAAWYMTDEELANTAAYVLSLGSIPREKLPGDPVHGSVIYARSACVMCHTLAGQGNAIGPDLTDVGARRGAAQLREALLHPEHAIPDGFLLVEAVPVSGDTIRGIRMNEDSFSIQIRDYSGRYYSLRKANLKELKKLRGETPMPSYQPSLSPAELDDLVAYLAAQRGEP